MGSDVSELTAKMRWSIGFLCLGKGRQLRALSSHASAPDSPLPPRLSFLKGREGLLFSTHNLKGASMGPSLPVSTTGESLQ